MQFQKQGVWVHAVQALRGSMAQLVGQFVQPPHLLLQSTHTGKPLCFLAAGDASMASPFTAKASSVAPVTDILKQGRCVKACGLRCVCVCCGTLWCTPSHVARKFCMQVLIIAPAINPVATVV